MPEKNPNDHPRYPDKKEPLLEAILSLNQSGYEFEVTFKDTKVIFESLEQQSAFTSIEDKLLDVKVDGNERLRELTTKYRALSEGSVDSFGILFPNLKKAFKQALAEGISKIQIEKGEIIMKCK
jgi:hypothetical protein